MLTFFSNAKIYWYYLSFMAATGRHFFIKKHININGLNDVVTVFLWHGINVLFRKNHSQLLFIELRFKYANDVAES